MPLKWVTRAGIAIVLLLSGALFLAAQQHRWQAASHSFNVSAAARPYEIVSENPEFPVSTNYGDITGTAAGKTALQRYTRLFDSEFSIYPIELIERTQLKRVVFCEELSFAGQRRSAVPDFEHDTLYLDITRGAYSRVYQREVIHHEFFHMIDWREHGDIYSDSRWAVLNPPNFHYGTGGKNAQGNPNTGVWTDKYPGFLDHYATTGVEEDKAEVFAAMMIDPAYIMRRCSSDAVLAAKVRKMKATMRRFCPAMDEGFWERVAKRQVIAATQ